MATLAPSFIQVKRTTKTSRIHKTYNGEYVVTILAPSILNLVLHETRINITSCMSSFLYHIGLFPLEFLPLSDKNPHRVTTRKILWSL